MWSGYVLIAFEGPSTDNLTLDQGRLLIDAARGVLMALVVDYDERQQAPARRRDQRAAIFEARWQRIASRGELIEGLALVLGAGGAAALGMDTSQIREWIDGALVALPWVAATHAESAQYAQAHIEGDSRWWDE